MNIASSEIRAHVVSVHEGTGRSVGPACGPVWLVEGGWGVCISSRAGEEGALCMTLSENTACGVPVLGLWDPRWVPCGAAQGPCRPARSLGSCPRPRGRWDTAAGGSPGCPAGGGVHARGALRERQARPGRRPRPVLSDSARPWAAGGSAPQICP